MELVLRNMIRIALLILVATTIQSVFGQQHEFNKSIQYGLMQVKSGRIVQVGYTTIHENTLWIKFDYELAEEFRIKLAENTPCCKIYSVYNKKSFGQVIIDNEYISFFLLIRESKQYFNRKFKRRI